MNDQKTLLSQYKTWFDMLRIRVASGNTLIRKDGGYAFLFALIHLTVSIFYYFRRGVAITADPRLVTWDWFWQSIPVDLLKTDLLNSIWYLHAQPPLYNLFMGVLVKLFSTYYLQVLQIVNILLGSLLSGMLYMIVIQLLPNNRRLAFGLVFILALNPSLFLFESYILYSLLCAFLVVLNIFCLSWYSMTKSNLALYCFMGSLAILMLTRSLYHILLLPFGFILVLFLASPWNRKRTLMIGSVICIIVFGWCFKNYFQYGFFGTSSWFGMGLWKIASNAYTVDELKNLSKDGILDRMVVEEPVFGKPSNYQPYGFDKSSTISSLSRDDRNNINIPDISRLYGNNAIRLMIRQPLLYARSIFRAYKIFCQPSSLFRHLTVNAAKLKSHVAFYADILQGRLLMSRGDTDYGSFLFFLLPIACALYALQMFFMRGAYQSPIALIRNDPVMFWCFILIVYTTLVSCSFEYGEQQRFKFDIEQIIWVFIPIVFLRCRLWFNKLQAKSQFSAEQITTDNPTPLSTAE